jgi:hypothetical protein
VRLPSRRDPLEWRKKRRYRSRPGAPHNSKFKQPRENIWWNCVRIILQTKMFVARVATLDPKSVDSVLENAACEMVFTVTRENALNGISSGSRDMYEEPIVRYRNHTSRIPEMLDVMGRSGNRSQPPMTVRTLGSPAWQ